MSLLLLIGSVQAYESRLFYTAKLLGIQLFYLILLILQFLALKNVIKIGYV